jgi:hypothetical protein
MDDINWPEYADSIVQEMGSLPWYVQERALETLRGKEQDVRFRNLADLPPTQKQNLIELLAASYEMAVEREGYEIPADENEIRPIHESEWHQGFNSECREHLGQDKDGGFYYAFEVGEHDDDLFWHGPYNTRDAAEEALGKAYERWDERTSEREQAYEDRQIAQFEAQQAYKPWRELKLIHGAKCDELSRQIAVMSGQANLPQRQAQMAYQQR